MASNGGRVPSIPPTPRRKVLRAGTRIVAEQFEPRWSEGPPEESELGLLITSGTITANKIQASSIQGMNLSGGLFAAEDMAKQLKELGSQLQFIGTTIPSIKPSTPTPVQEERTDGAKRNDGKPKRSKQPEPFYSRLFRRKGRR